MPRSKQRRWSWRHRRKTVIVGQLAAILLFILLLYHNHRDHPHVWTDGPPLPPEPSAASSSHPNPLLEEQAKFWRALYQIILNNDPQCDNNPESATPAKLDIPFDPSHKHPRPDVLWIEAANVQRLREAHSNFVSDIRMGPPTLVYQPSTRGIVMTASLDMLPALVVSIRMLRRTRSTLPVEVYLATPSDDDVEICDHVLPALNARCLLLSDVFQAAHSGVAIDKFQFKIMSILFSSFEEVLLLDADAFPLADPTPLFEQDPFNTTGMILWPDFWYPSESPYYFEIAKINPVPSLDVRPATESGEVMFSKSKHAAAIMLAAYYNYYGPDYYYPLLSQGAPGQGDKETFGWAATVMSEPFYAVHEPVMALGRFDSNGEYSGSAMAQHDPVADVQNVRAGAPEHDIGFGAARTGAPDPTSSRVRLFFIHANFPKFDPVTVFEDRSPGARSPTRDSNGTAVRCWMDEEHLVNLFDFDVERRLWEEVLGTACDYEQQFSIWKGKTGICHRVQEYWNEVFEPRH